MATDVFLVRHGESFSNLEIRFCGVAPGPGLTPRGYRQAQAAARRIMDRGVRPAVIGTSPLWRAKETATVLALATGRRVKTIGALHEVRFGAWEGLSVQEIADERALGRWYLDPERCPPPGGERLSEVAARVTTALARLAERSGGGAVVAFSHMHALVALVLTARRRPFVDHGLYYLPNAAIVHARLAEGGWSFVSLDPLAADAESGEALALG